VGSIRERREVKRREEKEAGNEDAKVERDNRQ
jgi:hypothetical protein